MERTPDSNDGRAVSDASDPQGNAAERLRHAVRAATRGAGSRDNVEEAARTFVDEVRGRNEPPEQMLIQVKALLGDAGLRAGGENTLYRDIITWSIRCYYEEPLSS